MAHDRPNGSGETSRGLVKSLRSLPHIVSAPAATRYLGLILILAGLLTPADALNMGHCCMTRARQLLSQYGQDPQSVCGLNVTVVAGISSPNPSVNSTKGWCQQNCSGDQLAQLSDWLNSLATWISPYVALLLLCPIGDPNNEGKDLRWYRRLTLGGGMFLYQVKEFIYILGDPASAIWGAFSQLGTNAWKVTQLAGMINKCGSETSVDNLDSDLTSMVLMAGQIKFDSPKLTADLVLWYLLAITKSTEELEELEEPHKGLKELRKDLKGLRKDLDAFRRLFDNNTSTPETRELSHNLVGCMREKPIDCIKALHALLMDDGIPPPPSSLGKLKGSVKRLVEDDAAKEMLGRRHCHPQDLKQAIQVMLQAKIPFVDGIILPAVLMLAVTGFAFYIAYGSLGDNTTAHNLAYCVLYSWLLIVVVVGNSYVVNVSAGLVKATIGNVFGESSIFSTGATLPLRDRYVNSTRWRFWLKNMGVKPGSLEPDYGYRGTDPGVHNWEFYVMFISGQMFGWLCVAFATTCAAVISYTTPTVGLGCRSFNHFLYGLGTLLLALWRVVCHCADKGADKDHTKNHTRQFIKSCVDFAYRLLVYINAVILVVGTALNIAGVLRSCSCMVLFTPPDFTVQLGLMTQLDIDMANRYWLAMGYVAFTFVWLVCMVAVVIRAYINLRMKYLWREEKKMPQGKNENGVELLPLEKSGVVASYRPYDGGYDRGSELWD